MSYVLYTFISCLVVWCRLMILLHWLASPPRLKADPLQVNLLVIAKRLIWAALGVLRVALQPKPVL